MLSVEPASRAAALDLIAATLLGQASRLTRVLMRSGSREFTQTEAGVLSRLAEGPRRITELAGTEALAQPSVSQLVDSLQRRGLVTRRRAVEDGRVVVVEISTDGRARLEAFRSEIRSLLHGTLSELQDDELTALMAAAQVLERVNASLQSEAAHG